MDEIVLIGIGVFIGIIGTLYMIPHIKTDDESGLPSQAYADWDKEHIHKMMTPEGFEWFVAQLNVVQGYNSVEVTQSSKDNGVDVILETDEKSVAVQVKRYKPGSNKVGSPEVQKSVGAGSQMNADEVMVVTTSSFTKNAKEAASETSKNSLQVTLVDGDDLEDILQGTDLHTPYPKLE